MALINKMVDKRSIVGSADGFCCFPLKIMRLKIINMNHNHVSSVSHPVYLENVVSGQKCNILFLKVFTMIQSNQEKIYIYEN